MACYNSASASAFSLALIRKRSQTSQRKSVRDVAKRLRHRILIPTVRRFESFHPCHFPFLWALSQGVPFMGSEGFFVVKLRIITSDEDNRRLKKAFDCATQITNATIRTARGRLQRMRQDADWRLARSLPAGKQRNQLFGKVAKKYQLTQNGLRTIANNHRKGMNRPELGAHEAQCIGVNVWRAIENLLFRHGGMPRYKTANRCVRTISGTDNHEIIWKPSLSAVVWRKHWYRVEVPDTPYYQAALTDPQTQCHRRIRYVRIFREHVGPHLRYSALLTIEGQAPNLHAVAPKNSVMGIDPGLSKFAFFTSEKAGLQTLAPNIVNFQVLKVKLSRKMDRSRRALNPSNFDVTTKTCLPGHHKWTFSKNYLRLRQKLREINRREKETRHRDIGTITNKLAGMAGTFRIERNSYRALQRRFGSIASLRAPGLLVESLHRLASRADVEVIELDAFALRLSQFDPITGNYIKPPLHQRWVRWGLENTIIQRDIKSALLAFATIGNSPDRSKAVKAFGAAEPLLREGGLVKTFQPRSDQDWATALSRLTKEPTVDALKVQRTSGSSQTQRTVSGTPCRKLQPHDCRTTRKADSRSLRNS